MIGLNPVKFHSLEEQVFTIVSWSRSEMKDRIPSLNVLFE